IGNRRAHAAAQACLDFEEFFAFICGVSQQPSIVDDLKDEIAGSRQSSTAGATASRSAPSLLLCYGIPRHEDSSTLPFLRDRADRRRNTRWNCRRLWRCSAAAASWHSGIHASNLEIEIRLD